MSHCSGSIRSSRKEPTLEAPWVLILDPTVWLDGARPTNTCVPPSFPWIRCEIMPSKVVPAPPWPPHGGELATLATLEGIGGQTLKPDSGEGGRDTDVGRSSSI
jgi:hypothetical protein